MKVLQDQLTPIIEVIAVNELKPSAKNPIIHSKKQIKQIIRSMQEFGYMTPTLIDGHRLRQQRDQLPCSILHLSQGQLLVMSMNPRNKPPELTIRNGSHHALALLYVVEGSRSPASLCQNVVISGHPKREEPSVIFLVPQPTPLSAAHKLPCAASGGGASKSMILSNISMLSRRCEIHITVRDNIF